MRSRRGRSTGASTRTEIVFTILTGGSRSIAGGRSAAACQRARNGVVSITRIVSARIGLTGVGSFDGNKARAATNATAGSAATITIAFIHQPLGLLPRLHRVILAAERALLNGVRPR